MGEGSAEEAPAAQGDRPLHYVGMLVRFSPIRGAGLVRGESGREVPFDLRFCEVAGAPRGLRARESLDVGLSVAFDVGWTSSGLRVTWLKPLAAAGEPEEESGKDS